MRIYTVIWSILIALSANAQGYYIHRDTVILPPYSDFLMGFDKDFNGLTIQSEGELDWSDIQVVVGNAQLGFDTMADLPFNCRLRPGHRSSSRGTSAVGSRAPPGSWRHRERCGECPGVPS